MLYRLYDRKNKRYIKADETMEYSVHPSGAVLHDGVEEIFIDVELSSQREDKDGVEIFDGDIVAIPDSETEPVFDDGSGPVSNINAVGRVRFSDYGWVINVPKHQGGDYVNGVMHFADVDDAVGAWSWLVIGTIHDEEMEAE